MIEKAFTPARFVWRGSDTPDLRKGPKATRIVGSQFLVDGRAMRLVEILVSDATAHRGDPIADITHRSIS
jgi:hypothetical protein